MASYTNTEPALRSYDYIADQIEGLVSRANRMIRRLEI